MKKARVLGVVAAVSLSLAGTAFAGFWSPSYVAINNLDTDGLGYVVYPGTTVNNPAGCVDTSPVSGYSGTSADERDLMDRTLLSAFLANRKVRLNIASTACSGSGTSGHPVYLAVRVDFAN